MNTGLHVVSPKVFDLVDIDPDSVGCVSEDEKVVFLDRDGTITTSTLVFFAI